MCLLDRYTARRGRSAVPTTFFRTRRWRLSSDLNRSFVLAMFLSSCLRGLAALTSDVLALVTDALRLVGLGLLDRSDLCRHLSDQFLIDAFDRQSGRGGNIELDALRRGLLHGV